ncbi:MAG TPA: class I SAM-dependent methyltransferase [Roseiflexaceae bacterium]|nr:class I SAM-dependent methyltransferase [Roseiflexaceae bacterium]
MSAYDALARYYDADHAAFDEDVPLYRELARRTGGRVLEAMCGSGRLLEPLARAGLRLVGVDSSAAMLALARERLAAAGLLDRVALHEGDVRAGLPPGPFGLAIVALNSFMHLTTTADQLAALGHLHAALAPGGLLALDLFNPDARGLAGLDGGLVLDRAFTLVDGARVQKFVAQRADMARQLNHVTFIYDELDAAGQVRRTTYPFTMRWLYRYELEHLLARCGFALEAVYGSYELDPFAPGSELMFSVARRV